METQNKDPGQVYPFTEQTTGGDQITQRALIGNNNNNNQKLQFEKNIIIKNRKICNESNTEELVSEQNNEGNSEEMKDNVNKMLSQAKLNNVLSRLKIRQVINHTLNKLPTRMKKSLQMRHYSLINDKAMIVRQDSQITGSSIFQSHSIKALPQAQKFSLDTQLYDQNLGEEYENIDKLLLLKRWMLTTLDKLLQKIPFINPSHSLKMSWDIIIMFAEIMIIMFIPIHIIYDLSFKQLLFKEIVVLFPLLLILDILINMSTGYFEKGELISNRLKILINYCKYQLLFDCLETMPVVFQMLFEISSEESNIQADDIGFFKLLQLIFMCRIRKFIKTMNKFQESYSFQSRTVHFINLFKLFAFILLMGHFFASLWLYIAVEDSKRGLFTWLSIKKLQEESWFTQYLYSYYFAVVTMMTIGFGDVSPQNQKETLVCIALMLLSCGMFGYNINAIDHICQEMYKKENKIKKNFTIINWFMKKKNVSNDLQFQIREYLDYIWNEASEDDGAEQVIVAQLSDVLREKLQIEANKLVLVDSPVFRNNFSEAVISKTVGLIKEYKCTPEEVIFLESDRDDCAIYFIDKGHVEIFIDQSVKGRQIQTHQTLQMMQKGESFGCESFFTGRQRSYNVRSKEFTTLFVIKRTDFLNLLSQYPEDYENYCFIKDNIQFYNCFDKINQKCFSCKSGFHQVEECPYIHFIPRKNIVIKRENFSVPQVDRVNHMRKEFMIHVMQNVDQIFKCMEKFQIDNEKVLDEYEIKYQLTDDLQDDEDMEDSNVLNGEINNNLDDSQSSEHGGGNQRHHHNQMNRGQGYGNNEYEGGRKDGKRRQDLTSLQEEQQKKLQINNLEKISEKSCSSSGSNNHSRSHGNNLGRRKHSNNSFSSSSSSSSSSSHSQSQSDKNQSQSSSKQSSSSSSSQQDQGHSESDNRSPPTSNQDIKLPIMRETSNTVSESQSNKKSGSCRSIENPVDILSNNSKIFNNNNNQLMKQSSFNSCRSASKKQDNHHHHHNNISNNNKQTGNIGKKKLRPYGGGFMINSEDIAQKIREQKKKSTKSSNESNPNPNNTSFDLTSKSQNYYQQKEYSFSKMAIRQRSAEVITSNQQETACQIVQSREQTNTHKKSQFINQQFTYQRTDSLQQQQQQTSNRILTQQQQQQQQPHQQDSNCTTSSQIPTLIRKQQSGSSSHKIQNNSGHTDATQEEINCFQHNYYQQEQEEQFNEIVLMDIEENLKYPKINIYTPEDLEKRLKQQISPQTPHNNQQQPQQVEIQMETPNSSSKIDGHQTTPQQEDNNNQQILLISDFIKDEQQDEPQTQQEPVRYFNYNNISISGGQERTTVGGVSPNGKGGAICDKDSIINITEDAVSNNNSIIVMETEDTQNINNQSNQQPQQISSKQIVQKYRKKSKSLDPYSELMHNLQHQYGQDHQDYAQRSPEKKHKSYIMKRSSQQITNQNLPGNKSSHQSEIRKNSGVNQKPRTQRNNKKQLSYNPSNQNQMRNGNVIQQQQIQQKNLMKRQPSYLSNGSPKEKSPQNIQDEVSNTPKKMSAQKISRRTSSFLLQNNQFLNQFPQAQQQQLLLLQQQQQQHQLNTSHNSLSIDTQNKELLKKNSITRRQSILQQAIGAHQFPEQLGMLNKEQALFLFMAQQQEDSIRKKNSSIQLAIQQFLGNYPAKDVLLDFDIMKSYVVYFPQNNVENVMKSISKRSVRIQSVAAQQQLANIKHMTGLMKTRYQNKTKTQGQQQFQDKLNYQKRMSQKLGEEELKKFKEQLLKKNRRKKSNSVLEKIDINSHQNKEVFSKGLDVGVNGNRGGVGGIGAGVSNGGAQENFINNRTSLKSQQALATASIAAISNSNNNNADDLQSMDLCKSDSEYNILTSRFTSPKGGESTGGQGIQVEFGSADIFNLNQPNSPQNTSLQFLRNQNN